MPNKRNSSKRLKREARIASYSPLGRYFCKQNSLSADNLELIFDAFIPLDENNPILNGYEQAAASNNQTEFENWVTEIESKIRDYLFTQNNLQNAFIEIRRAERFDNIMSAPNAVNIIIRAYVSACLFTLNEHLLQPGAQVIPLTDSVEYVLSEEQRNDSQQRLEEANKFTDRILKVVDKIHAKRQQAEKLKQFLNSNIETIKKIDTQGNLGRIFNTLDKLDFNPVEAHQYDAAVKDNTLEAWVNGVEQQVEQFLFIEENLKKAFEDQELFSQLMRIPDAKYAFISSYVLACTYTLFDHIAQKHPRDGEIVDGDCEAVGLEHHDENADLGRQEENAYISRIHKIINDIHQQRKDQENQAAITAAQVRPASTTVNSSPSSEEKQLEPNSPSVTQSDEDNAIFFTPPPATSIASPHKQDSLAGSEFSTDGADTSYGTPSETGTPTFRTPEPYLSGPEETPEFVSIAQRDPSGRLLSITIIPHNNVEKKEDQNQAPTRSPRRVQPQRTQSSSVVATDNFTTESKEIASQLTREENLFCAINAAIVEYRRHNLPTSLLCCFESQGTRRVNKLEAKLNKVKTADKNSKLRKFTELTQFVNQITSGEDYWCIHKRRQEGLDYILINSLKAHNLPVVDNEKYSKQVEESLGRRMLNHR